MGTVYKCIRNNIFYKKQYDLKALGKNHFQQFIIRDIIYAHEMIILCEFVYTYYIITCYIIYRKGRKHESRSSSSVKCVSGLAVLQCSLLCNSVYSSLGRKFSLERTALRESHEKKEGNISLLLFNECSKAL